MVNCIPKLGGQFELEWGGQFAPKLMVNLHWNRVVNLTGFSMHVAGNWKISIVKEDTDRFIVSVLFFNENISNDTRKKVPPILLKGTA